MQYQKPFRVNGPWLVGLFMAPLFALTAPAQATAVADSPNTTFATPTPASPEPPLSGDALHVWRWVMERQDHAHQPYAIVDKKGARLYVFDADGQLVGASSALLGQATGDHSTPGVADADVHRIPLADRTTPAGRFASQPGRNLQGEAIVWFDYQAALAIHRVRPGSTESRRMAGLATPTPADNRASLGCVVVTPEFYLGVVQPVLGQRRGVVYVLPETQPVQAYFGDTPTLAIAPR